MKRTAFLGLIVLLTGLVGCSRNSSPKAKTVAEDSSSTADVMAPADPKGISTVAAEVRPIRDFLDVPGHIQPDPTRVVHVFPPVGGRLIAMEVRPGDRVRRGQTIAVLESSEVAAARADYQKARADAEVKGKGLRRASMLYENKVLPEKDYLQAQADAEMAEAELNRTLSRLKVLGIEPEGSSNQFRVVAPRSGVVLDIGAAAGEISRSLDSPQPLCTLADLSSVWALGDVLEKDLAVLRLGSPAEVTVNAYPLAKWTGRVAKVSDVLDPFTHTVKVRVVLANADGRLKPEMFATIRLPRAATPGLVIPAAAVVREGVQSFVFVQKGAGRYERRRVTVGRMTDSEIEITVGLKPGEVVVAEGALLLRAAAS